jgi:hypothetical protein
MSTKLHAGAGHELLWLHATKLLKHVVQFLHLLLLLLLQGAVGDWTVAARAAAGSTWWG